MASPRDISYGKIAVKNGFMNQKQVDECIEVVDKEDDLGNNTSFEEVAVSRNYLDDKQAQAVSVAYKRIKKDSEKRSMSIEGYEILTKIGEGGLGVVYKARQISMNRIVALKILHRRWLNDEEFKKRFLLEARLVGKLSHQNLIKVFDVGKEDWKYFFTMEFIEGESVEDILDRQGKLDTMRAINIAIQSARALKHIKETMNIVHCDIKPGNILLTLDNVAKLGDFGFVRSNLVSVDGEEGTVLGTPDYISPEQAAGKEDIDYRSDIYSLGASLYHMVTGKPPFEGTASGIMRAHIRQDLPTPRSINPKLTGELSSTIEKMMEKKPEDRYQDYGELFEELELARIAEDPEAADIIREKQDIIDAFKKEKLRTRKGKEEVSELKEKLADYRLFLIIAIVILLISLSINIAFLILKMRS
ncbi:MAG: serine/threonine protein kinase [Planctomycetota bacterium]|jgi:serine/threonine-protein kinase